ncbi:MAG: aromatic amino acid transport family protein [Minisyncoccia bacterium]
MFTKDNITKAEALFALIGTIIGAGVFVLPYLIKISGLFATIFWFIITTLILLYLHLAYGELVLRTAKDFRLPGFAGYYLGSQAKKFLFLTTNLTFAFSLLIYLILGAKFLQNFFSLFVSPEIIPLGFLVIITWLFLSIIILSKKNLASKVNLILSLLLLIIFIVIGFLLFPHIIKSNFNFQINNNRWFFILPYGVLFYALNGMVAIPEVHNILKKRKLINNLKNIIINGILITVFCYLIFMISVYGVSGENTTIDAISGLKEVLGKPIIILGSILGFLAVITSYLMFALYIKNSFTNDFHFSPFVSNFLVILSPITLYFLGINNLPRLMSILGATIGGLEGIIILMSLKKAKEKSDLLPNYEINLTPLLYFGLIFALLAGALIQSLINF